MEEMALAEKLKEHGWNLSEKAINQISEDGKNTDVQALIPKLIDMDLREISIAGFPSDLPKTKYESIPGKFIVQIQKIRNVSAPKANEESNRAPRMLKLFLTDGQTSCQAVEVEFIRKIGFDTPPGTKLYLKSENLPMASGYILLQPSFIDVLGGKVQHMVDKWELNLTLTKYARRRVVGEGGPPPWIPFGEKILKVNPQDKNFKSLETTKEKENRENAEFEAQRKDAIEAARTGARKVFGGGQKQLLDYNVQQIVNCGYTVDEAEVALRQNKNNTARALRALERRDGQRKDDGKARGDGKSKGGEERERKKRGDREDETGVPPKPSGKIPLFAFLEDKLPISNDKDSEQRNSYNGASNGNGDAVGTLGLGNSEKKNFGSDSVSKGNPRGNKSDRTSYSQGRGGGNRGGSGGKPSGRGSRSSNGGNLAINWNAGPEQRAVAYHNANSLSRDSDRSRHTAISGTGGSSLQQQKPPRFQNQQRIQQQQQQHHQQQQQQHNSENIYSQSAWPNSYNDHPYSVGNWPGRSPVQTGKPWDEFPNHRESYQNPNYDQNKTRPPRTNNLAGAGYGMSYDPQDMDGRALANRLGNGARNFMQQQQPPEGQHNKYNALAQSVLGNREPYDGYPTAPPPHRPQQHPQSQQMFSGVVDYGVTKEPQVLPMNNNSHSTPSIYGTQPNHYSLDQNKIWRWQKGDRCMAKYWEDNVYYNAEVTGVSERTCVVRFLDYGNFEEVLQDDCKPVIEDSPGHNVQSSSAFSSSSDTLPPQNNQNHFSGILEFRRGGTRPYIKSSGNERKPPRIQQQIYMPPAQRK